MLKVMDGNLCAFKDMETLEQCRDEIKEMTYTLTIDELPYEYTIVNQETDEVLEHHKFDLLHKFDEWEPE